MVEKVMKTHDNFCLSLNQSNLGLGVSFTPKIISFDFFFFLLWNNFKDQWLYLFICLTYKEKTEFK